MAARTTYAVLEFSRGELKQIEAASSANEGVDSADLLKAEANAMRRVNQFILRVAGPVAGAAIVSEFSDDANSLDPIVVHLAELIAAADVLEQWERYNYSVETRDGTTTRKDASDVRGRATKVAQDIIDAGGTLKSDGTFRRWFYASNQQGPRVGGPMRNGSYFHTGTTPQYDAAGRPIAGPIDPARWAGRS
jgi:hypothetical protein